MSTINLEEDISSHFNLTEEERLKYENIIESVCSLLDVMSRKLAEGDYDDFREKLLFDLKAV